MRLALLRGTRRAVWTQSLVKVLSAGDLSAAADGAPLHVSSPNSANSAVGVLLRVHGPPEGRPSFFLIVSLFFLFFFERRPCSSLWSVESFNSGEEYGISEWVKMCLKK